MKHEPDFYEDKNYEVVIYVTDKMNVPFKANEKELNRILRLHSRPNWLKPRDFGVTTNDGNTKVKIDLRKVFVIEANEIDYITNRRMAILDQTRTDPGPINTGSTNGPELNA